MKRGDTYYRWAWSAEDDVYLGRCPDIMGIHGDDSVRVYAGVRGVVRDAVRHFEEHLPPEPHAKPVQEAT